MFDVINDKPEGYIMYKHEPVGRGFIQYTLSHQPPAGLCVRNPRAILHEGFVKKVNTVPWRENKK